MGAERRWTVREGRPTWLWTPSGRDAGRAPNTQQRVSARSEQVIGQRMGTRGRGGGRYRHKEGPRSSRGRRGTAVLKRSETEVLVRS